MSGGQWRVDDVLRQFLEVKEVADTAREALARAIVQELLHQARKRNLSGLREALDYLAEVREGFVLTVRTERVRDPRELMYLVNRLLMDWGWLRDLGIDMALPEEIERVERQLVAFTMAAVAFAFTPKLPPEAVTFPLREFFPQPTYSDIPVPRTPAELWERIEEVEKVIYAAGVQPLASLPAPRLRRTYAFFEANAWIAEQQVARFLGD